MPDYSDNPKKDSAKKKESLEKVVNSEVIQKPKGPGRKFKEVFFGGDAKAAASYVATDVLLPALRNLIVDAITKGVENLIYGQNRRRNGPFNYGSAAKYQNGVSYSRGIIDPRDRSPFPVSPRNQRAARHEINDIVISTKEEAELVLDRMVDVLDKYDSVSLADLYELLGLPVNHIDQKWGWTFLGSAGVHQVRQGYLLQLPPLEEL